MQFQRLAIAAAAALALAPDASAQFTEILGLQPVGCGGNNGAFQPAVDVWSHRAMIGGVHCTGPTCSGSVSFHDRLPDGSWSSAQTICNGPAAFLTQGVALHGDWAMTGGGAGSALVFERVAGTWSFVGSVPGSPLPDDSYEGQGNFLSMDGERAIRGYARNGLGGTAYVLELDSFGDWQQVLEIGPDDGHAADFFGCDVSLSGNIAIVGAKRHGADSLLPLEESAPGAAYIFERQTGGVWTRTAKLTVEEPWIDFGRSVSIDGERAVVGATTPSPPGVGAAFVFERMPDGTWVQTQRIQSLPSNNDFGASVAIAGDQLAVGAADDSQAGPNFGAVYVYERGIDAVWTKIKTLFAAVGTPDAGLGSAVAFDGGVLFAIEQSAENAVVFEAPALPYGCGVNPEGSLSVLGGSSQLGDILQLGVDNPLGTQAAGSIPILFVSAQPFIGYPCGVPVPGLGMESAFAPGEVLVGLAPTELAAVLSGQPWVGPGTPSVLHLSIPTAPALAGVTVFLQGALSDPSALNGVGNALTDAIEIRLE